MGDPDLGSRGYFNTADQGVDTSRTKYQEETFWGTHAAIGGAPWDGDHPSAGSQEFDITAAIRADQFIRKHAVSAGVEINELKDADYGF